MKLFFLPPKKANYLIYDRVTLNTGMFEALFKIKNNFSVMDVRYESINLYILFLSLITFKFKELKNIYKKKYLEIVKPKIVYTSIDNNPAFFNLKNLYPNALYVSDQNGIAKVVGQSWPNDFYKYCISFNKLNKKKLKSDLIFTFNENDKKYMSKIIDSNVFALGNSKINNIKSVKKKIKKIIFINSGLFKQTINKDVQIFKIIKKYAYIHKYKLILLSRKGKTFEEFYRKKFGNGKWIYKSRDNANSSYNFLKKSNDSIIAFSHSTLGFEAMAIGFKCVIFLHKLAKKNSFWINSDKGFFWTNNLNYFSAKKLFDRVIKCDDKKWKLISKKISNKHMSYDFMNKKKKILINKYLNIYKNNS